MPIYAYRCESCGFAKDVLRKISDPLLTDCPQCGKSTFRKQVTAAGFQLKGSGWYVTDFREGGSNTVAKPAADAKGGAGESGGEAKSAGEREAPRSGTGAEGGNAAPAAAPATSTAPVAASAAAAAPAASPSPGSSGSSNA